MVYFLDKLLPGDIVLADRGFDISDSVGTVHARLHIPAFTKGKNQLLVPQDHLQMDLDHLLF